ncbi:permease [Cronobacter dublinensis]|uniref:permease n=1 Tax=Enterobacteriaceae TaxID=543 RepID=UPI0028952006|nr:MULTISPECIES: permease [Enterobacteriaceae]MDT3607143.1 permease [Cronobacter dublinensis]MEC3905120.1 permease [Leclercia adecarboxylata]
MPLSLCLSLSTLVGLIIAFVDTRIAGFWYSAWAAVLLCALPGLGVWLGNIIRKWVMLDAVYGSTGAVIQARLFWAVMPQFIGWFIGFMAAMGVLGIRA